MTEISLRYFEDVLNNQLTIAVNGGNIRGISAPNIAWPEKTYVPKKGVPYIKPELAARVRQPMGVGADAVQEWRGTWQVGVFTSRDLGSRMQNQIASDLLAAFPRGMSVETPQNVWMVVIRGTVQVPVPFQDWINTPVMIDWFAHQPPASTP